MAENPLYFHGLSENESIAEERLIPVQAGKEGDEGIAGFEDLNLEAESSWHGETDGDTYFYSGSYRFTNSYTLAWDSWMGFAYANLSSSTYVPELGYGNQYKNAAGGGASGSATYGVVYDHGVADLPEAGETGALVPGCYVTNNIMLYNAAVNGDDYPGGPFETGDYFKVFFRGLKPDGDTAVVEYYLADFRDADTSEHYILDTWEWVDLSPLGNIRQLLVGFEGSRKNQFGPLLPSYMAIDEIGTARPQGREVSDSLSAGSTEILAYEDLFSLPGKGKWHVTLGEPDAQGIATLEAAEDGLKVSALEKGNCRVDLKATRNGRSEYVTLTLAVGEGLGAETRPEASKSLIAAVYPVPANDYLNVSLSAPLSRLQAIDLQGRKVYECRQIPAASTFAIPVSGWPAGMYILRAESGSHLQTVKVVVR